MSVNQTELQRAAAAVPAETPVSPVAGTPTATPTGTRTGISLGAVAAAVQAVIDNIKSVIVIDTTKLEYIIASKIAGGHVILADSHGVGKTSLARALAGSIRWSESQLVVDDIAVKQFSRIQCTVDLLPQDILGYNRVVGQSGDMVFNQGPIFSHFVLCDEINLLTPKTQGSFLQAMEEQAVSIEGRTYRLPDPFFIIATMNLKGAHLFPLPAPQLDRFTLQMSLGFPDAAAEEQIILQHGRADGWKQFGPVVDAEQLIVWKRLVDAVEIHPDVVNYIVRCVAATRNHPDLVGGASPRSGIKISRLVRALALVRGRRHVDIDLVQEVFVPAIAHRLVARDPAIATESIALAILDAIPIEPRRSQPVATERGQGARGHDGREND